MLFLLFQIRDERYCLEASRVIEVAPMVQAKPVPLAPPYVAGLINYRGAAVPVIDLATLLYGSPCRPLLSTRIILVDYESGDGSRHALGLLAEHVTETISRRKEDFQPPGIEVEDARFLGEVVFDDEGMVRRVEVEKLLPESLRDYLFTAGKGGE